MVHKSIDQTKLGLTSLLIRSEFSNQYLLTSPETCSDFSDIQTCCIFCSVQKFSLTSVLHLLAIVTDFGLYTPYTFFPRS